MNTKYFFQSGTVHFNPFSTQTFSFLFFRLFSHLSLTFSFLFFRLYSHPYLFFQS